MPRPPFLILRKALKAISSYPLIQRITLLILIPSLPIGLIVSTVLHCFKSIAIDDPVRPVRIPPNRCKAIEARNDEDNSRPPHSASSRYLLFREEKNVRSCNISCAPVNKSCVGIIYVWKALNDPNDHVTCPGIFGPVIT